MGICGTGILPVWIERLTGILPVWIETLTGRMPVWIERLTDCPACLD
jgi:hypothetical protein